MPLAESLETTTESMVEENARQAERIPLFVPMRVARMLGAGLSERLPAQSLNISDSGLAFLIAEPFETGTLLHLELLRTGSVAMARVRDCTRRDHVWRVGVEFTEPFVCMS